jgi:hypothetical protein
MALLDPGAAWSQESASYSLKRLTVSSGTGQAASSHFDVVLTLGQTEPAGSVSFCNSGYGATLGFWSGRGETPVPSFLSLAWISNPGRVDLAWSGAAASFQVFRSASASSLFEPGSLFATTTGCVWSDDEPLSGSIYYYGVMPVED